MLGSKTEKTAIVGSKNIDGIRGKRSSFRAGIFQNPRENVPMLVPSMNGEENVIHHEQMREVEEKRLRT